MSPGGWAGTTNRSQNQRSLERRAFGISQVERVGAKFPEESLSTRGSLLATHTQADSFIHPSPTQSSSVLDQQSLGSRSPQGPCSWKTRLLIRQ